MQCIQGFIPERCLKFVSQQKSYVRSWYNRIILHSIMQGMLYHVILLLIHYMWSQIWSDCFILGTFGTLPNTLQLLVWSLQDLESQKVLMGNEDQPANDLCGKIASLCVHQRFWGCRVMSLNISFSHIYFRKSHSKRVRCITQTPSVRICVRLAGSASDAVAGSTASTDWPACISPVERVTLFFLEDIKMAA